MRRAAVASLSLAVAVVVAAAPSNAAFPGRDGYIAFEGVDPNSSDDYEIYIERPDGSGLRNLTHNHLRDDFPSMSPDGRHVVFQSEGGGQPDIYSVRTDGTHERRLTTSAARDVLPSYSPDGKHVIFERVKGPARDLLVMRTDGSHVQALTHGGAKARDSAVYSPDGKRIAFALATTAQFRYELGVMHSDGSHLQVLTHNLHGGNLFPSWTPDGKHIVFESDRGIDVIRREGSNRHALIRTPKVEAEPSVSPSGQSVVFTSGAGGGALLRVARIDGSRIRSLDDRKLGEFNANWGPR